METKVKGLEYDRASLYPNTKEFSSSQILSYLENPNQFFLENVLGVLRAETQAMFFGKVFSATYRDRKFKWLQAFKNFDNGKGIRPYRLYQVFEQGIAAFPVIPKKQCEYPLRCKYRGYSFRATLDGYYDHRIDIENKTGAMAWTQERADESEQVTFQYWVKWKKDGALFDYCQLNWLDTRANATKLVHTFNTTRTIMQLQEFEKKIDYAINGIELEAWD